MGMNAHRFCGQHQVPLKHGSTCPPNNSGPICFRDGTNDESGTETFGRHLGGMRKHDINVITARLAGTVSVASSLRGKGRRNPWGAKLIPVDNSANAARLNRVERVHNYRRFTLHIQTVTGLYEHLRVQWTQGESTSDFCPLLVISFEY